MFGTPFFSFILPTKLFNMFTIIRPFSYSPLSCLAGVYRRIFSLNSCTCTMNSLLIWLSGNWLIFCRSPSSRTGLVCVKMYQAMLENKCKSKKKKWTGCIRKTQSFNLASWEYGGAGIGVLGMTNEPGINNHPLPEFYLTIVMHSLSLKNSSRAWRILLLPSVCFIPDFWVRFFSRAVSLFFFVFF